VTTIGLAIIARDEADNLPALLASVAGAFDSVVLADTGSTDATVQVFEEWATVADLPRGWRVESFPWCDDFAAAREFADSLLTSDWRAYADADDELRGAEHLRSLVASAPPEVACLAFDYENDRQRGPRVRLTRRGWTCWEGRAHAVPVLMRPGLVGVVPAEVAAWVHRRSDWTASDERDRRILAAWLRDEPDNPRALSLAGIDALRRDQRGEAVQFFRRYLDHPRMRAALGPAATLRASQALDRLDTGSDEATLSVLFGLPLTDFAVADAIGQHDERGDDSR
jgi:glycosyltransferase involved in cell wall biosynthesis